ncbi:uncharacterized protein BO95DRAFT_155476 [Aspergillus brunneoviolaceus CBS 621.78]|uniref:Uncharacterized protein n=1 Tax=Aspergillus brunneoviolaceus CBS 621.78 TaxID=1450534 RepID=A0ACD1GMS3_9EURO|nr:hypothetical protein BO95DRAFT_155476 [Aspergillus brunneoviolaceus CBS 621.78]RAH50470.1 hypothetical protein BO95DRAFT_155476 [Aspergillus brunneoviolaceus CBS 621.78]
MPIPGTTPMYPFLPPTSCRNTTLFFLGSVRGGGDRQGRFRLNIEKSGGGYSFALPGLGFGAGQGLRTIESRSHRRVHYPRKSFQLRVTVECPLSFVDLVLLVAGWKLYVGIAMKGFICRFLVVPYSLLLCIWIAEHIVCTHTHTLLEIAKTTMENSVIVLVGMLGTC